MGRHLGRDETKAWLKQQVFWPSLYKMVERFCAEHSECQKTEGTKPVRAPPVLLLLVGRPFDRIATDITEPSSRSWTGYQFILVIIIIPPNSLKTSPCIQ